MNIIYLICNIDIKNYFNNHGLLIYINNLEDIILSKYSKEKKKNYKIKEYFNNNFIKKYSDKNYNNHDNHDNHDNQVKYILKISGIWVSNNNIGVTFKFLKVDSCLTIS